MAKYIDAEKLIHDLEERIFAYSEGYAEGDGCRKDAIETLLKDVRYQCSLQQEQQEVDLEKDVESWFFNEISSKINVEHTMYYYFQECARRYFELGKNSK